MAYVKVAAPLVSGEAYRHYEPDLRRSRLSARLEAFLAHRDQITALDLAGDDLVSREVCSFLTSTARVMRAAYYRPCRRSCRAGKHLAGDSELGAERIGHGVKAIEDRALMIFSPSNKLVLNPV